MIMATPSARAVPSNAHNAITKPRSRRVRSDALPSLSAIGDTQHHAAQVTPSDKAGEWLPWVHVAIGNLKTFLLGTYHGVSSVYLQEYLNEFCYRFNRREWEAELPLRLLNACLTHTQVKLKTVQRHKILCVFRQSQYGRPGAESAPIVAIKPLFTCVVND